MSAFGSRHRGHAAAQALDRGRVPSTISSVMVGGLLDLESAQAETAQQKLERSTQGADAAAVLSRTQCNRKRRHPSFIAERRDRRYVPGYLDGVAQRFRAGALARGLSCGVCDVRAALRAGVRELGRAKFRTRRHDQYVRVPSITSLSATYSLHSVPQIRRTCSRSSLALRRLPCSACHMP